MSTRSQVAFLFCGIYILGIWEAPCRQMLFILFVCLFAFCNCDAQCLKTNSLSYTAPLMENISCIVWFIFIQSLELWNMVENKSMTVSAHENIIAALAQSPVTGMVASASHDSSIKLWKWRSYKNEDDWHCWNSLTLLLYTWCLREWYHNGMVFPSKLQVMMRLYLRVKR